MLSPTIRRLVQASLMVGAFSLCFGVVAGARGHAFLLNVAYDAPR